MRGMREIPMGDSALKGVDLNGNFSGNGGHLEIHQLRHPSRFESSRREVFDLGAEPVLAEEIPSLDLDGDYTLPDYSEDNKPDFSAKELRAIAKVTSMIWGFGRGRI